MTKGAVKTISMNNEISPVYVAPKGHKKIIALEHQGDLYCFYELASLGQGRSFSQTDLSNMRRSSFACHFLIKELL